MKKEKAYFIIMDIEDEPVLMGIIRTKGSILLGLTAGLCRIYGEENFSEILDLLQDCPNVLGKYDKVYCDMPGDREISIQRTNII